MELFPGAGSSWSMPFKKPAITVKNHLISCARQIHSQGLCALLVSEKTNIAYLTGCHELEGYLLITESSQPLFFTNFLYKDIARKYLKGCACVVTGLGGNIFQSIADHIKKLHLRRVGFEAKQLPYLEYTALRSLLAPQNISLIETVDLLRKLRMVKTGREIALIKKSIAVSLEAFRFASYIRDPQMTEKDLAIEIEKFMRLKADNRPAFDTIVAAGANSCYVHHHPKEEQLREKNVLIDLGSKYYGYCADLTRMFFYSKMPILFKKIYDTIRKAQERAIAAIRDGAKISDVDRAARSCIDKGGWGKYFGHGLGHGVGLEVHEPPYLRPDNPNRLQQGMVITVEPAVYLPQRMGFRIEDMVLVGARKADLLSQK